MTVCSRKIAGILHPSSTTIIWKYWYLMTVWWLLLLLFWWEKFFRNSIKSLSNSVWINFFYWTPFLFFSSNFLIYQLDFSVVWPIWALRSLVSSDNLLSVTSFYHVSEFLCFLRFWMLWMLVAVNKVKFSLQKTVMEHPRLE